MNRIVHGASKRRSYGKAIATAIFPFILMISNGYCNKAENLKLFDNIVTKDALMGNDIQKNLFSLKVLEEQNVRNYLFEYKFKKTALAQHYICAVTVAGAGVFIDPQHYKAEYDRLKKEYMKARPGRWRQQLHLHFPEIGRRTWYGHIFAGPGGAACDLSMTTSDGRYDVKVLISNLMPASVEGPDWTSNKSQKPFPVAMTWRQIEIWWHSERLEEAPLACLCNIRSYRC